MDLDDWIQRIRSRDPMTYEDAYHDERPSGPDFVLRLIVELHRAEDSYTRGKFSELLGETEDPSVVPVLIAELEHPDPRVGASAMLALEHLAIPEGLVAATRFRKFYEELP